MKRTIMAVGGIVVLLVIGLLAWNAFRPDTPNEPAVDEGETAVVAQPTNTNVPLTETDEPADTTDPEPAAEEPTANTETETEETPVETADLPLLPQVQGGGQAQGVGGGGAAPESLTTAQALPVAGDLAYDQFFTDIFSGTTFVADTAWPSDVSQALVWQQSDLEMTLAEAQQIAQTFGFSGPIYVLPEAVFAAEGDVSVGEQFPITYFVFDGSRALTIDAYGTYYRDESVSYDFEAQLSLDQIAPAAEAFVQSRGLVDFPYVVDRIWGNDVLFFRLIDGRPVNQAEVTITVNDQGEVAFASNQKLRNLNELGTYPLRTAEEAFQLLQGGVLQNNIWYTYTPADLAGAQPVEPLEPPFDQYRAWLRTYQPGAEAHVYAWPSVFLPADGVGVPRVEAYPFIMQGSDELLQSIAANPNQQFHFWGTVGENGRMLNLTGVEPLDRNQEPVFVQGMVRVENEQVLFVADSGDTYIIPDAPADLPSDEQLNMFGWAVRDTGAAFPVIDWESIDLYIEYPEGGVVAEPAIGIIEDPFLYEPTIYQEVRIGAVELIYAYSYIHPEFAESDSDLLRAAQMPTVVLQPAWKFTGTADNGDQIEFVVEAVAPEFIQK